MFFDVGQKALDPALKLAPELGPGHQAGEVQKIDLLPQELGGHLFIGDPLGDALGDGGLSHPGLPDETGVVFGAPVEDLHDPVDLLLPADDGVQLALPGPLGEVFTEVVQELIGGLLLRGGGLALRGALRLGGALLLGLGVHKVLDKGDGHGAHLLEQLPILAALQGLGKLVGDGVDLVVGDAHAGHHVVHGLETELPGAFETETLVDGLAVFDAGHVDHCGAFAAAAAFGDTFYIHLHTLLLKKG